jgi:hypothetical protein
VRIVQDGRRNAEVESWRPRDVPREPSKGGGVRRSRATRDATSAALDELPNVETDTP